MTEAQAAEIIARLRIISYLLAGILAFTGGLWFDMLLGKKR